MLDRLLAGATRPRLIRWTVFLAMMLVAMNLAAWAFYRSTGGVGLLDFAGGAHLLDNRLAGYTPAAAHQMLADYGPAGRRAHLILTLSGDVLLPIVMAGFFGLAIGSFYRPLLLRRPLARALLLLPLVYLAADYGENIGIVAMLRGFPAEPAGAAGLANTLLMIKSLTATLGFVAAIGGWAAATLRRTRNGAPGEANV
jgi:hypothetical protein